MNCPICKNEMEHEKGTKTYECKRHKDTTIKITKKWER
jgi:hypothetical protein